MSAIHARIEELGRQGALALPEFDRATIEAAHAFMSAEEQKTSFLFSGWCQTALPHRRLKDDEVWTLSTDHVTLMVEPGSVQDANKTVRRVGVPYGSRARLILLYLQSEAIKTNSREIELGRSLRSWLGKLGVPIGGKSLKEVREQSLRISRCRMTFQIVSAGKVGFVNQNIVDTAIFSDALEGDLLDTVKLSETFYAQLRQHCVPLQETAISAISNNSMALDVYCWLAYRLHVLDKPTPITWSALHAQFGAGMAERRHFKEHFISCLRLAMAVYPEAQVDIERACLVLRPSSPPVPPKRVLQSLKPIETRR